MWRDEWKCERITIVVISNVLLQLCKVLCSFYLQIWKTNYSFLTDLGKEEESTLRERVKSDEVDDEEKARIKEYLQKLVILIEYTILCH